MAAQQAIRVTRQLLTFARHEVTTPEIIDLNEAVESAGKLLRRALGEHIELAIAAEPALWRVKADRGQLEQVLVNLAVNARDAMPGGGQLTIDTAQRRGRRHLREPAARPGARALRPAPGLGHRHGHGQGDRGPGLRAVLLDQAEGPRDRSRAGHRLRHRDRAGGTIDIYSEAGTGHDGQRASAGHRRTGRGRTPGPVPADDDVRGHGETILLVEDEVSLRELARRILARNGYQVCVADNGADAVRRAGDPAQPIDLLLTDVIMPEMLGHEVAARVAALRPETPALFLSGYAQPILDAQGVLLPGYDILEKPFTEVGLLSRVRMALGARL